MQRECEVPLQIRSDLALPFLWEETRLLSITGWNKQTNKENRRNRNEQKAGDKPEVGSFHDRRWLLREGITSTTIKLITVRPLYRNSRQKTNFRWKIQRTNFPKPIVGIMNLKTPTTNSSKVKGFYELQWFVTS